MNKELTDRLVAFIAGEENGECAWRPEWMKVPAAVALAVEVQQSRQRRCENCVHWSAAWVTGGAAGWCEGPPPCCRNETAPDYFCANFTPVGD
jgi:hypothetical protein